MRPPQRLIVVYFDPLVCYTKFGVINNMFIIWGKRRMFQREHPCRPGQVNQARSVVKDQCDE